MADDGILTQGDDSAPRVNGKRLGRPADFIVTLIQALLRTGYYTPEHPESEKARVGLYTKFHQLELKKAEVSFLIRGEEKEKSILVEGILRKPCHLKALMPVGMARLYDAKLVDFLERKELVSLTLKQKMEHTEFHSFVDIMSAPILMDMHDRGKRERFLSHLRERNVKHVSFIFNEDLVITERKIPWRAWIAISRLKKDITLIPILRDLDQEDLKQVKKEVVFDVLRPLGDPTLCFYTLVNTDVVETKLMQEEEIEDAIMDSLSGDMFFDTIEAFIKHDASLKEEAREEPYEKKILRIARSFAVRLGVLRNARADYLLESLFENKLIRFEELPAKLRERAKAKRFIRTFLDEPDGLLTLFERISDQKEYHSLANSFLEIISPLIDRNKFREVFRIVRVLGRHAEEQTERAKEAQAVIDQIRETSIPEKLKTKFVDGNKETRLALYPIFGYLESFMIEPLIDLIKESEDKWVRKNAVELLIEMGPGASGHLEQALKDNTFDANVTIDIMQALSMIESRVVKGMMSPALHEFRRHMDPEVRRLALHLLSEAQGSASEEMLIEALDDSSDLVREAAIKRLACMGSEKALDVLSERLENGAKTQLAGSESTENQIFLALGSMVNMPSGIERTPEEILLRVLARRGQSGGLSKLFKKKTVRLSDEAISIICESLGRVGTPRSEPVLTELAKDRKKPWSRKAKDALEQIEQRSWFEVDDPVESALGNA
jgi:HEAT repeat protein